MRYAGLADDPEHAAAQRYLGGHGSGVLTFGLPVGARPAPRFLDALKLFTRLVNLGMRSHRPPIRLRPRIASLDCSGAAKAGVSEDTVRLSIGIEHIGDLRADLEQGPGRA